VCSSDLEPKTLEAFLLSAVDDLDAKMNQVKRALRDEGGSEEFTAYQKRLGRVLYRGE
jgi:23S rRNA maturation-related 3'-5' exoribonuclease YhaM